MQTQSPRNRVRHPRKQKDGCEDLQSTAVDETELESLLPRLLGAEPWSARKKMIDAHSATLLTEVADGRLAVILTGFEHDRRFQERIEAVRLSLADARDKGHDGADRPLSDYLRPLYTGTGPLASFEQPMQLPDEVAALAPHDRVRGAIGLALLRGRSWDVRRRILAGYPESLASGDIEKFLVSLAHQWQSPGTADVCLALAKLIAIARTKGPEAAATNGENVPYFSALSHRDEPLTTEDEARQMALLAYIDAPTWPRRRRVLEKHTELLLTDNAIRLLDFIATRYGSNHPITAAIPAARDALVRAQKDGIGFVFGAPGLRPTHIRLSLAGIRSTESAVRVSCLRQAVHFVDPDLAPWTWAQLNVALASELVSLRMQALDPFLMEEALLRVQQGLEIISRADIADWRKAQELLGQIYLHRMRGDAAANAEASINALTVAGEALPPDGAPEEAMSILIKLGQAFLHRPGGVRATNLQLAAKYLRRAISDECRKHLPLDWAWAQVTYGQVCAQRPFGNRAGNLAEAADHLQEALAVPELSAKLRRVWASANLELARIFAQRPTTDPRGDLAAAQEHLAQALKVFTRNTDTLGWALAQDFAGAAYFRRCPDDAEARAQACRHFTAALEVLDADTYPNERRQTLTNFAGVLFLEHQWANAAAVLEEAVSINEYIEKEFARTDAGRIAAIADMGRVYERLAFCLLKLGDLDKALRVLDAGKTHQLRRVLAATEEPSSGDENKVTVSAWQRLRELVPERGGLVVPVITTQGSAAFVVGPAGPEQVEDAVITLADTTDKALREILDGVEGRTGWVEAYQHWLEADEKLRAYTGGSPQVKAQLSALLSAAATIWAETMSDSCRRVWDLVIAPIHDRLVALGVPEGAVVVFLPSRWLFLLPISAAWRQTSEGPRYLVDDFAVSVCPSATVLASVLQGAVEDHGRQLSVLAVIDPTGDLPAAQAERDALVAQFGAAAHVLEPEQATPETIAEAAPSHTHLHFACHGNFDWLDPMGSGLALAGGSVVSARDVAAALSLPHTRCVTLSACETGVIDTEDLPYEYVGLAGAFLQSGVPAVLSSLWTVDDESTAMLMATFYAEHAGRRVAPPQALRSAQIALRKRDEFQHPFYWAAFQMVGL